MPHWVHIGSATDIPAGGCRLADAAGAKIAVFNIGGTLHAIEDTCPHRGGPLSQGMIAGAKVTCPWHFWSFEIRTGRNTTSEEICVKVYPLEVRDGRLYADVG